MAKKNRLRNVGNGWTRSRGLLSILVGLLKPSCQYAQTGTCTIRRSVAQHPCCCFVFCCALCLTICGEALLTNGVTNTHASRLHIFTHSTRALDIRVFECSHTRHRSLDHVLLICGLAPMITCAEAQVCVEAGFISDGHRPLGCDLRRPLGCDPCPLGCDPCPLGCDLGCDPGPLGCDLGPLGCDLGCELVHR